MKQARKKWVEALRSGKYEQGKGQLRQDNKFCCLGVACDILETVKWEVDRVSGDQDKVLGESTALPAQIQNFYGLNACFGSFLRKALPLELQQKVLDKFPDHGRRILMEIFDKWDLTQLNDAGVPFEIIADIIEIEPEGLFKQDED